MKPRIYHNPRCSKSRATLALLEEHGVEPEIIEYLNTPPDAATITALLGKLGLQARDIIRTNEEEFKASGLSLDSPAEELIGLIERAPKVLQRPIVEVGSQARIGRPPEQVLDIIA